jgi:molybdenum cofactor cytidylyltransferase
VNVVVIVLAAGASTRFGSQKLLAPLDGRPVLQHVLDAVSAAAPSLVGKSTVAPSLVGQSAAVVSAAAPRSVVVVLGDAWRVITAGIDWRHERRVVNPRPADGLSSSLRVGLDAAAEDPAVDAVLVVLGDQPSLRPAVLAAVIDAAETAPEPIIRVRYADDEAPNPVLLRRSAWALAAGLDGDRGVGPLLAAHPELVAEVAAPGRNPDVDTTADLARLAALLPSSLQGGSRVH